jgi:FkbM family methyltransferase
MKLNLIDRLHMRHRLWTYRYKSEVPSIRYLLDSDLYGKTLVDIGANWGVFCYYLSRKAGPAGRVFAFEAQPELGPHLEAVKATFHLDNLEIINNGLSSTPGIMQMRRSKIGSGGASFHHGADTGLEELDIPVTTLDDYFANHEHDPISLIKCDVEGHELHVFKGGKHILAKYMPVLLFEVHHRHAQDGELFSYLAGLGYDGYFFHVSPIDHRSLLHKGRGQYIHYSEFDHYDYVRPTVQHRNYIFLKKGMSPVQR